MTDERFASSSLPPVLSRVPLGQVGLRLASADVARVPFPLPLTPNTAWEDGPNAALWLGPDEWLITEEPGSGRDLVTDLSQALAGVHHSAIDLSANRAAFELTHADRHELLAVGCAIDLHPRAWTTGSCVQTLLGKVPVLLHERADSTRLLVRPSYAAWLTEWLEAAAALR